MLSSKRRSSRPATARCRPDPHRRPLSPAWWLAAASLPILAAAWAGVAHGQSLMVQATVTGSCSINSLSNVNFGSYESGQTGDVTAEGGFTVTCPSAQSITIALDGGERYGATGLNERAMAPDNGGADRLGYDLYIDTSRTIIWGDGTVGTVNSPGMVDSGNPYNATVFGKVRGGQTVDPGTYTDTVTITVDVAPAG